MKLIQLSFFFLLSYFLFPSRIISIENQLNSEITDKLKELEKEIIQQEESFDKLVDNINQKYDETKSTEIKTEHNTRDRKKLKQDQKKNSLPDYSSSIKQKDKFDEQLERLSEKQKQNEDIFEELDSLTESLDKEFAEQMEQIDLGLQNQKNFEDVFSLFQIPQKNPFEKIFDFLAQAFQNDINENNKLTACAVNEDDKENQAPTFLSAKPKHKTITKTTKIFKNAQGQTTAIIEETEIHTDYKKIKKDRNLEKNGIEIVETTPNKTEANNTINVNQEYLEDIELSKHESLQNQTQIPNITVSSNKNKLPVKISQEKTKLQWTNQTQLYVWCSLILGLIIIIYLGFFIYRSCAKYKSKIKNEERKKFALD